MPYSDNLYSAYDDSDSDGHADPLSPSDGYFATSGSSSVVPSVPNVMVPDPTLRDQETAAESKAREADQERRLNSLGHARPTRHGEGARNPELPLTTAALSANPPPISTAANTYPAYTSYSYTPSTSAHAPSSSASASAPRLPRRSVPLRGRSASVYSDAPPAYTPSATSPLSPSSPTRQALGYGTIPPSMGIENEHLLGRGPESMGLPHDEEAAAPSWNRRVRRRLPAWLSLRMVLLASVLLVASFGFLASSYRVFKDDGNQTTIKPQPPPEEVVAPPGEQPQTPAPSQPGLPALQPLQPTFCSKAPYRFPEQIMAVGFSQGRNLSFVQDLASRSGPATVRIGGQINIRKLDQGGDPRVLLEIVTNDKDMRLDVLADEADQAMRITAPKHAGGTAEGDGPCVEMRATIFVPEGGELLLLGVKTTHLDILLLDDLSLKVTKYSRLESDLGDIISAIDQPRAYTSNALAFGGGPDFIYAPAKSTYTFDSRITEVHNVVGNIGGTWPLYDVLGLHTTGGNTQVSIAPQPVLESAPKSAVLSLSSVSGSISATEPIHALDQMPVRDYLVDLHSTSGKVRGALAFSMGIELKSTASDLAVDLLPVLDQAKVSALSPAQLETGTTSGTTAVRVLDPVWHGQKPPSANKSAPSTPATSKASDAALGPAATLDQIRAEITAPRLMDCLQAVHKSTSGNIGLKYPQSWVGDFVADSTAGTLNVRGPDVKVTKSTGGWGHSELKAYKGSSGNASTIQARTMIGNVDCSIGAA